MSVRPSQFRPGPTSCLSNKFSHRVIVVGLVKVVEGQEPLGRCCGQVKGDEPLQVRVGEDTPLDEVSQYQLGEIPMGINEGCRHTRSKGGEEKACEKAGLA